MSALSRRQQRERRDREAAAWAALSSVPGRVMTCTWVGQEAGLSMMASYWALRRLVRAGRAESWARAVEAPGRKGELAAVFRAVQPPDGLAPWPSWLCGTVPSLPYERRGVMGRAGLLAGEPRNFEPNEGACDRDD